jgi:ribosome biogenesis GTPase
MKQGQIITLQKNQYIVKSDDLKVSCVIRGKIRQQQLLPRVGDFVLFDENKKVIEKILPRKNSFLRPLVSNIDQAIIVTSVKEPDFSLSLLDRLLTLMELAQVEGIICLTKLDLISDMEKKEILEKMNYYQGLGYKVVVNTDLDSIKELLKDKTSVFIGQTGAGKSTLLNKLSPDWKLKTGEISKALGRGKHTTRTVELFEFLDGQVLDTPGFSALNFEGYKREDIKEAFREFKLYTCPFKDCSHTKEGECEIKRQVEIGNIMNSRYQAYLQYLKEVK